METNEVKQMTLQHTPLPWFTVEYAGYHDITTEPYYGENSVLNVEHYTEAEANAAFIVEACNNYYSLRSQVEELKKENERLREDMIKIYNELSARPQKPIDVLNILWSALQPK